MCMVKKTPKPSLMVVYYAKLTEIFWVSGSHLYHAYAWFKLFSLQKSFNKNLNQKDLQLIASSVVLAALSVSPYDSTRGASHLELEHEKERNLRMANLIGFIIDPKLESREVVRFGCMWFYCMFTWVFTFSKSDSCFLTAFAVIAPCRIGKPYIYSYYLWLFKVLSSIQKYSSDITILSMTTLNNVFQYLWIWNLGYR